MKSDPLKNVLIVKTSSLGDVIHALPALTDAARFHPDIVFDWVVEQPYAQIPTWHPNVRNVIPCQLRRWRKKPLTFWFTAEWHTFLSTLRAQPYDAVIDAQGLVKSALITRIARGLRYGFDKGSVRESLAARAYQVRIPAPEREAAHAISRIRTLFAGVFGYPIPTTEPDYGVDRLRLATESSEDDYLVFLHGTTWATKHWPTAYWVALAKLAKTQGLRVKIPWGNAEEKQRAEIIAAGQPHCDVLPKLDITGIAGVMAHAKGIVAVDTGLGHLAAALRIPTLSLYGPTNAAMTGSIGHAQMHLSAEFRCAPCLKKTCAYQGPRKIEPACFEAITPERVWEELTLILSLKQEQVEA